MADILSPLPWQQSLWVSLGHSLKADKLHHAYLLAGPAGVGKARFAQAFARLLLCESPRDGMNCGQCHSCDLMAAQTHADSLFVTPEDKSRAIKVEQIRKVIGFIAKTTSFGQRKVVLIDPAQAMNLNAANALLKSLEEPSRDTCLLLVCDQYQQLPATLRSRCQLLRFALPSKEDSLNWLNTVTGASERSEELLALSAQSPVGAARLFQDSSRAESLTLARSVFAQLCKGELTAMQALPQLTEHDPNDLLLQLEQLLQGWLKRCDADILQTESGQGLFQLLDLITHWRGALSRGANPNVELLKQQLLLDVAAKVPLKLACL